MDARQLEVRYGYAVVVSLVGAALLAWVLVVLGANVDARYYTWLYGLVAPISVAWVAYKQYSILHVVVELRKSWGNAPEGRQKSFQEASRLHRVADEGEEPGLSLDNQTWKDLGMDEIFVLLNRALTGPGEQVLYRMLRKPELSREVLERRDRVVTHLADDPKARERLQLALRRLGRERRGDLSGFLWGKLPQESKYRLGYTALAALALLSLATIPFLGKASFLVIAAIFGLNMRIHYKLEASIASDMTSLRYLAALIGTAARLGRLRDDGHLAEYLPPLGSLSAATASIGKKAGFMDSVMPGDLRIMMEYASIFFLVDVRNFYAVLRQTKLHIRELQEMFLKVGELDALLSIASYRTGSDGSWTRPTLVEGKDSAHAIYEGKELRHPLVEGCVPNSISIHQGGAIVTGSNMAGKSTFLRTVGINAVLAQTIFTCTAGEYHASLFRVMSSLTRGDDLQAGKSYYLMEAEGLLSMLRASDERRPLLLLIDEILSGTNSAERISASTEILRYVEANGATVLVSTHDLGLTKQVGLAYQQYHFSEGMGEGGLVFDYRIKAGISSSRNAIKLMAYLGFPSIVTDEAERIAKELIAAK